MNTKAKIIGLAAALLLLAALPAICQDDVMTIGGGDYGFEQPQRAPVLFTHTTHMELEMVNGACAPCHHDGKDDMGQFVEADPAPCKSCHDEKGGGDVPGLMKAYHAQCQGCHQEAGKGPIACGECHVQKDFFGIPMGGDMPEAAEEGGEEKTE